MNTLLYEWLIFFLIAAGSVPASGQTIRKNISSEMILENNDTEKDSVITKTDEKYIQANAEMVIRRYMDLLNFISTSTGLETLEVEKIIQRSYSLPESKIFYDSTSIVENDLLLFEKGTKSREKAVFRYLKDFDLLYKKSTEATVTFSNLTVSNVKSKDYLYIKVFYNCLFNGSSRVSDQPFALQKRVAELKVEKVKKAWKTWITSIHFSDSLDIINAAKNDVSVVNDPETGKKRTDPLAEDSSAQAANLEKLNHDNHKSTPDELYRYYIKEALFAESLKKNEEALHNYKLALISKPDETDKISSKVRELATRIDNLAKFEKKYMSEQYKDAIKELNNAIRKDDNYADYYFGKGRCYEKTGDFTQAMKEYSKAVKIDPTHLQAFTTKAALNEKQGAYADAIADYKVCASLDKKNIFIYHKIAALYINLGNLDAAVDTYDKVIAINDQIQFLFQLRGEVLYKLNRQNEAEASFSRAILLDSSKANTYFYRGLCRLSLKNSVKASEDFIRATLANGGSTFKQKIQQIGADFYKAGLAQYESENITAAIKQFELAGSIDPGKDRYHFMAGECYFKLNDWSNAVKKYTEAIKLNPNYYEAFKQRAASEVNESKYEEAISDFSAAIRISPKQYQTYKYLGDAYLKNNDFANAITNYEVAISVSRTSKTDMDNGLLSDLYNNTAAAYHHLGNPFKTIQNYDEAVIADDNDGRTYFNRGTALLAYNELDQAEADFRKATELNDTVPLWHFRLGELYQKKGEFNQAIKQYTISSSLNHKQSERIEIIYNRAACLAGLKKYADALKEYKWIEANKAEGNFKNFHAELGGIYLKMKYPDSALIYLDMAILKDSSNKMVAYQKAIAYVQKKQADNAFAWLEKALSFLSRELKQETVIGDFAALEKESQLNGLLNRFY